MKNASLRSLLALSVGGGISVGLAVALVAPGIDLTPGTTAAGIGFIVVAALAALQGVARERPRIRTRHTHRLLVPSIGQRTSRPIAMPSRRLVPARTDTPLAA